jgi:riboflavin kinase/FMN adenylyltransferase
VANLGVRPTVGGAKRLLEVHLFDFSGDLYGQNLEVFFETRLRGEMKFPTLEVLRWQIANDVTAAREILAKQPA